MTIVANGLLEDLRRLVSSNVLAQNAELSKLQQGNAKVFNLFMGEFRVVVAVAVVVAVRIMVVLPH